MKRAALGVVVNSVWDEGRAPDQLDGMVVGTVAQEICRLSFEGQGGVVEGKKVGGPFLRQRGL